MKLTLPHFLTGIALALLMPGCENTFDGNVTGTYTNTTDTSITEITVNATQNGYSFTCVFDDNREDVMKSYRWNGTFSNVPADMVLGSDGKDIGSVEFGEGTVTFKAKTQRPDTYKAYADDMADLMRSRSVPADSVATDK